ncbi:MAG: BrnA antitoxin family protein [Pseudomonadota bacterium]
MGKKKRRIEEARIRESMAALVAQARNAGAAAAGETAADPTPVAVAVQPARRTRGPQKAPTKQAVSIRLDADLVEELRETGQGWQTRVNAMLRKAMNLQT